MKSKAQIYGHPLHPMIVVVPMGAFLIALIMDILYLVDGAIMWWEASFPIVLIGVIGALLAAVPGVIDLFTVVPKNEARRTGVIHMGVNVMMTVLFIINALVRWGATSPPGEAFYGAFVLSIVGVGLMLVGGWLGGKLVYEKRVGVIEASELEAQSRRREARKARRSRPPRGGIQEVETPG